MIKISRLKTVKLLVSVLAIEVFLLLMLLFSRPNYRELSEVSSYFQKEETSSFVAENKSKRLIIKNKGLSYK